LTKEKKEKEISLSQDDMGFDAEL